MCLSVLSACMNVHFVCLCMPHDLRNQKKASNPLVLELWMLVRHRVSAGNPSSAMGNGTAGP